MKRLLTGATQTRGRCSRTTQRSLTARDATLDFFKKMNFVEKIAHYIFRGLLISVEHIVGLVQRICNSAVRPGRFAPVPKSPGSYQPKWKDCTGGNQTGTNRERREPTGIFLRPPASPSIASAGSMENPPATPPSRLSFSPLCPQITFICHTYLSIITSCQARLIRFNLNDRKYRAFMQIDSATTPIGSAPAGTGNPKTPSKSRAIIEESKRRR